MEEVIEVTAPKKRGRKPKSLIDALVSETKVGVEEVLSPVEGAEVLVICKDGVEYTRINPNHMVKWANDMKLDANAIPDIINRTYVQLDGFTFYTEGGV